MPNILSAHHRLLAISKGGSFFEADEGKCHAKDKIEKHETLNPAHTNYLPDSDSRNNIQEAVRSIRIQDQADMDVEQSNKKDTATSSGSDEEFYDCSTEIMENTSNEHQLSQQKRIDKPQSSLVIVSSDEDDEDDEDDDGDVFSDCVNQQVDTSSAATLINSKDEILDDKDPAEQMLYHVMSSVTNYESYIMDNPDFFVSLFNENPESMIDVMSNRLDMLDTEITCWLSSKCASEKFAKIKEKYDAVIDSYEANDQEQAAKLFKILVTQLTAFEQEFGITPYEDICKAALLLNSSPEIRDFFGEDLLTFDLMDLVNSENNNIHKSNGSKLASCIKRQLDNSLLFLQGEVNSVLADGLKNTVFATNHGDTTPEHLYHRVLNQEGGITLVKQWLEASIKGKWSGQDGGFAFGKDEKLLLTELNNHAHSVESFSSWMSNNQNVKMKQHLQGTLTIIYAQLSMDAIKEKVKSTSGLHFLFTSQVALCHRCFQMLAQHKSKASSFLRNSFTTMLAELQQHIVENILSTGCIGFDPAYFLPRELSPKNCKTKPHLQALSKVVMRHLMDLIEMKNSPLKSISISEEVTLKDKLLVAQMDLLFKHAQEITGTKGSETGEADFDTICHKIEHINEQRARLQALKGNGDSYYDRAIQIGLSAFYKKEVPVATRLRTLRLKHQIKLDGYNYAEEKSWIYSHLTKVMGSMTKVGVEACQQLDLHKNNPSMLLWSLFTLKDDVNYNITEVLRQEFFDEFQELMKSNPMMARNFMGDIAQTAAIVQQMFGGQSMIAKLFEQMEKRAWGETAQSYVNERFYDNSDYQQLNEQQKASIKHMFALCEMLKTAPTTIQAVKVGVNVAKNIACANFGTALYDGMAGAVELIGIQKIQHDISAMSDAEVRTLNLALLSLQGLPAEVMVGMAALWQSADNLADSIKDPSTINTYFRNSTLLRPFLFRFNRLSLAITSYSGGNGDAKTLALELSKVGLISSGALCGVALTLLAGGGVAAALGVSALSWFSIGVAASVTIPPMAISLIIGKPYGCPLLATAHMLADTLMEYESLEAPATVIWDLLSKMRKDPNSELSQLKEKLTSSMKGIFQQNNPQMKEYHALSIAKKTCVDVYQKHWGQLICDDYDKALSVLSSVEKIQADSAEAFEKQANKLQVKLKTWRALQSFIHTLPADSSYWTSNLDDLRLDDSDRQMIGIDPSQYPYAAISAMEMIQEEIQREAGIELNWQEESIKSTITGKEITIKDDNIKTYLLDYQKRMLLGDYLAGNFSPASKALSKTRSEAEAAVLKIAEDRCTQQAANTADIMVRLSINDLVSLEQDSSGRANKAKVSHNLRCSDVLKKALKQQVTSMKASTDRCIKKQISDMHDSLEKLNINVKKSELKKIVSQVSSQLSPAN